MEDLANKGTLDRGLLCGLRSTAEDTTEEVAGDGGGDIGGGEVEDIQKKFPLMGKDVVDCPPRMRFAPSPTGRYDIIYTCTFCNVYTILMDHSQKRDGSYNHGICVR